VHSFKAMQKQGTQISRVPVCLEVRPKKILGVESKQHKTKEKKN
jgi:hypothetical protein